MFLLDDSTLDMLKVTIYTNDVGSNMFDVDNNGNIYE